MSVIKSVNNIEDWFIYKNYLSNDLNPPADDNGIFLLDSLFSNNVDQDLITFYKLHNGFPDWMVFRDNWHIMSVEMVQEIYIENLDLYDDIIATDPWRPDWLPFASNGTGDYMFIDLSDHRVYFYYHEGGEKSTVSDYESFINYMENVSKDFMEQRYVFSDEDGLTYKS